MDIACINILINPSIEDVIKIEKTNGFAEKRSQEIRSNTNESTSFQVAYSITSRKLDEIETLIFKKLDNYRENNRKNTFKMSIDNAIGIVEKVAVQVASKNYRTAG